MRSFKKSRLAIFISLLVVQMLIVNPAFAGTFELIIGDGSGDISLSTNKAGQTLDVYLRYTGSAAADSDERKIDVGSLSAVIGDGSINSGIPIITDIVINSSIITAASGIDVPYDNVANKVPQYDNDSFIVIAGTNAYVANTSDAFLFGTITLSTVGLVDPTDQPFVLNVSEYDYNDGATDIDVTNTDGSIFGVAYNTGVTYSPPGIDPVNHIITSNYFSINLNLVNTLLWKGTTSRDFSNSNNWDGAPASLATRDFDGRILQFDNTGDYAGGILTADNGSGGDGDYTNIGGVEFSADLASGVTLAGGSLSFTDSATVSNLSTTNAQVIGNNLVGGATNLSFSAVDSTSNAAADLIINGTVNNGGGTVTVKGAGTTEFGGSVDISGTGEFVKNESGTALFGANQSYTGKTTVNAGLLDLATNNVNIEGSTSIEITGGELRGGSNSIFNNSADVVMSGGTLTIGTDETVATISGNGGIVAIGVNTLTVGNDTDKAFSGSFTGSGGFDKVGSGEYDITGATLTGYSGTLTVTAGTLKSDTDTLNNNDITNNAIVHISESNNKVYSGVISGTGSLVKDGVGELDLTGNNTYTGDTTVNAGTLKATGDLADSTDVVTAGTGNFELGADQTVATLSGAGGTVNLGSHTLTAGDDSDKAYAGVISGTGSLVKNGAGELDLTGNNTYTGDTTVNAGTLKATGDLADSTDVVTTGTGNFELGADQTVATLSGAGGTVNLGSHTLTAGDGSDKVYAGVISGTGSLVKDGVGELDLTGNNTYTGDTTVNAGTLKATGDLADSTDVVTAGTGNFELGADQTVATLSGAGGTVNLGGHTLTAGDGSDKVYAGVISGTGSLVKDGVGELDLTGNNTYTGDTTVNAGTLKATGDLADSTDVVTAGTGNFELGADQTVATLSGAGGTVNLGGHTLTAGDGSDKVYAGVISGTGSLVKDGVGELDLTGNNTYTGDTTVNAGTLKATGDLADSTDVVTAGTGNFELGADQTVATLSGAGGTVNLGGHMLTAGDDSDKAYAGVISGTGSLVKEGDGSLDLTGNNTYTGDTTVNAGTLKATGDLADSTDVVTTGSGNFELGADQTVATLSGAGGTVNLSTFTLTTGDNTNKTYAGVISGTGNLIKDGAGELELTGSNTYSGGTVLSAGTLKGTTTSLQGNIATGNSTTVEFSDAGTGTYADVISGTGAVLISGTGEVTLSGVNTYNGDTTVSAGKLIISGSVAGNVINNSLLEASGNIGGSVTIDTISTSTNSIKGVAGNLVNTAGITTVSGTVGGTTTVTADSVTVQGTGVLSDTATVNGGTLTVQSGGQIAAVNNNSTFDLQSGSSTTGLVTNAGTATIAGTAHSLTNSSGTATVSGTVTNDVTLGGGEVALTGSSSGISGNIVAGGGKLSSDTAKSFSNLTFGNNVALVTDGVGDLTFSGTVTTDGDNTLTVTNSNSEVKFSGTSALTGADTLTVLGAGDTRFATSYGGTLTTSNAENGTLYIDGTSGAVTINTVNGNGNVVLSGDWTVTNNGTFDGTVTQVLASDASDFSFTTFGSSSLGIDTGNAAHTYTGTITVGDDISVTGGSTATFTNGGVNLDGTAADKVTVGAGTNAVFDTGTLLTLGTGDVTKDGVGTLTLNNTKINDGSSALLVTAGTVAQNSNTTLTGDVTSSGTGVLNLAGTVTGDVTIGNINATANTVGAVGGDLANAATGTGVNKVTAGAVSGEVTNAGGDLTVASAGSVSANTGNLVVNGNVGAGLTSTGGTVDVGGDVTGAVSSAGNLSIGGDAGSTITNIAGNTSVTGTVGGSVAHSGTGVLTLADNVTSGNVTIDTTSTSTNSIKGVAGNLVNTAGITTVSGTVGGTTTVTADSVTVQGTGVLSDTATVNGGTLTVQSGGQIAAVNNNSTFDLQSGSSTTGLVTNAGTATIAGTAHSLTNSSGTATVSGTVTNDVTLGGGEVALTGSSSGISGNIVAGGGKLSSDTAKSFSNLTFGNNVALVTDGVGDLTFSGTVTTDGDNTLTVTNSNSEVKFSGTSALTGADTLTVLGAGDTRFATSYGGTLTTSNAENGTLYIDGTSGAVTINTVNGNGNVVLSGDWTVTNNGTFDGTVTQVLASDASDFSFTTFGSSSLGIDTGNAAHTYTGTITVGDDISVTGGSTATFTNGGVNLDGTAADKVTVGAGTNAVFDTGTLLTLGTGDVTKDGVGTLTLNNTKINDGSSALLVTAGTVAQNSNTTLTGDVTSSGTGVLNLAGTVTGDVTIGNINATANTVGAVGGDLANAATGTGVNKVTAGAVSGEVTNAGGDLTVASAGSVSANTGNLVVNGNVGAGLTSTGGTVDVGGDVTGAVSSAGNLSIGGDAGSTITNIAGNTSVTGTVGGSVAHSGTGVLTLADNVTSGNVTIDTTSTSTNSIKGVAGNLVNTDGITTVSGTVGGTTTVTADSVTVQGTGVLSDTATVNGGTLTVQSGGQIAAVNNNSTFDLQSGSSTTGLVTNAGTATIAGTAHSLTNSSGTATVSGTVTNDVTLGGGEVALTGSSSGISGNIVAGGGKLSSDTAKSFSNLTFGNNVALVTDGVGDLTFSGTVTTDGDNTLTVTNSNSEVKFSGTSALTGADTLTVLGAGDTRFATSYGGTLTTSNAENGTLYIDGTSGAVTINTVNGNGNVVLSGDWTVTNNGTFDGTVTQVLASDASDFSFTTFGSSSLGIDTGNAAHTYTGTITVGDDISVTGGSTATFTNGGVNLDGTAADKVTVGAGTNAVFDTGTLLTLGTGDVTKDGVGTLTLNNTKINDGSSALLVTAGTVAQNSNTTLTGDVTSSGTGVLNLAGTVTGDVTIGNINATANTVGAVGGDLANAATGTGVNKVTAGAVSGEVTNAGGDLTVASAGSVSANTGNLVVNGNVGAGLTSTGGTVDVGGDVTGAVSSAGNLSIGGDAGSTITNIAGNTSVTGTVGGSVAHSGTGVLTLADNVTSGNVTIDTTSTSTNSIKGVAGNLVNTDGITTVSGTVGGTTTVTADSVTVQGTGVLSDTATVNGGTLTVQSGGQIAAVNNNSTFDLQSGSSTTGLVTNAGTATIAGTAHSLTNSSGTATVSGTVTNDVTLGGGEVALTGSSSGISGNIVAGGGKLSSDTAKSFSNLTFGNNVALVTDGVGDLTFSGTVTTDGDNTLTVTNSNSEVKFSGTSALTGADTLTVLGAGDTRFATSYGGTLTTSNAENGTLYIDGTSGAVTINTVNGNGNVVLSGDWTVTNNGTFDGTVTQVLASDASDFSFTTFGSSSLGIDTGNAAHTYTGTITVGDDISVTGGSTATFTNGGVNLDGTAADKVTVGAGTNAVFDTGTLLTLGTGDVTKDGVGTLTLNNTKINDGSSALLVTAGTVAQNSNTTLTGDVTSSGTGVLNLAGTVTGDVTVNTSSATINTFNDISGSLINTAGVSSLSGTAGSAELTAGTLNVVSGGVITGNVADVGNTSILNLEDGGTIGGNIKLTGGTVNVRGTWSGSVDIASTGGTVAYSASAAGAGLTIGVASDVTKGIAASSDASVTETFSSVVNIDGNSEITGSGKVILASGLNNTGGGNYTLTVNNSELQVSQLTEFAANGLNKAGAGDLTLTGDSSAFTGTLGVDGGEFNLNSGALLGAGGNGDVTLGGTATVASAVFAGDVGGDITATDVTTLNVSGSVGGDITVAANTTTATLSGTTTGDIDTSATTTNFSGSVVNYTNTAGTSNITGTISNALTVNGIGVNLDDGASVGSINLAGGVLDADIDLAVSDITGTGGTLKVSSGTTTWDTTSLGYGVELAGGKMLLSGVTATGASNLTMTSGSFEVASDAILDEGFTLSSATFINNGVVSGAFTQSGGILNGVGSFGNGLTVNGGTHAPGNSIGTQTISSGNYILGASGTLYVELDNTSSDKIVVSAGNASLADGSTFKAEAIEVITQEKDYVIIETSGGVTANFDNINTINVADTYMLDYSLSVDDSGNNLILSANPGARFEDIASGSGGDTNLKGVGHVLDQALQNGHANDLLPLFNLSESDLKFAMEQMNPQVQDATITALQLVSIKNMDSVMGHLTGNRSNLGLGSWGRSSFASSGATSATGDSEVEETEFLMNSYTESLIASREWSTWISGIGEWGFGNKTNLSPGYDWDTYGVQIGIEKYLGSELLIGFATGLLYTDVDGYERSGTSENVALYPTVYAGYTWDNFNFDLGVGYGHTWIDTKRPLDFINKEAKGSYGSDMFNTWTSVGYLFEIKKLMLEPYVNLAYSYVGYEGYTEKDAGAYNLTVAGSDMSSLRTDFGGRISTLIDRGSWKFRPRADFAWRHEYLNTQPQTSVSMMDGNWTNEGQKVGKDSAILKGGVDFLIRDRYELSADYQATLNESFTTHTVNIGLKINF